MSPKGVFYLTNCRSFLCESRGTLEKEAKQLGSDRNQSWFTANFVPFYTLIIYIIAIISMKTIKILLYSNEN